MLRTHGLGDGPRLIAASLGACMVLAALAPGALSSLEARLALWFDILAVFAFVVGGGHLVGRHLERVAARAPAWGYSAVTAASFLVTLTAGLFKLGAPSWETDVLAKGTWFRTIHDALLEPLLVAAASLLAFATVSAARRALRARTLEGAIVAGAAAAVLLAATPAAAPIAGCIPEPLAFLRPEAVGDWLLAVPGLAGQRGILLGAAIGAVAVSLRVLFGAGPRAATEVSTGSVDPSGPAGGRSPLPRDAELPGETA